MILQPKPFHAFGNQQTAHCGLLTDYTQKTKQSQDYRFVYNQMEESAMRWIAFGLAAIFFTACSDPVEVKGQSNNPIADSGTLPPTQALQPFGIDRIDYDWDATERALNLQLINEPPPPPPGSNTTPLLPLEPSYRGSIKAGVNGYSIDLTEFFYVNEYSELLHEHADYVFSNTHIDIDETEKTLTVTTRFKFSSFLIIAPPPYAEVSVAVKHDSNGNLISISYMAPLPDPAPRPHETGRVTLNGVLHSIVETDGGLEEESLIEWAESLGMFYRLFAQSKVPEVVFALLADSELHDLLDQLYFPNQAKGGAAATSSGTLSTHNQGVHQTWLCTNLATFISAASPACLPIPSAQLKAACLIATNSPKLACKFSSLRCTEEDLVGVSCGFGLTAACVNGGHHPGCVCEEDVCESACSRKMGLLNRDFEGSGAFRGKYADTLFRLGSPASRCVEVEVAPGQNDGDPALRGIECECNIEIAWCSDMDGDTWTVDGTFRQWAAVGSPGPELHGYCTKEQDCDDYNSAIHPYALEGTPECDGIDNDCDGEKDETALTFCPDLDGDGCARIENRDYGIYKQFCAATDGWAPCGSPFNYHEFQWDPNDADPDVTCD